MSRSVLITGCSDNGLGAALAIAFHKAGFHVLASGRNLSKLNQVTAAGIDTVKLDVTGDLTEAVAEVSKKLGGKLDILLNNAGAILTRPITDLKLEDVRQVFELNTFSLISMTQAFLPLLRAAPQGWIVNNTSVASVLHLPMQSAYNASKAAASSLTQALRLEMAPFNIKVVELRTGAVKSVIFDNATPETNAIPSGSLYAIAADEINTAMSGRNLDSVQPADEWARQVVSDLSTRNPSIFVWRGGSALLLKYLLILPLWVFDSTFNKVSGLTAFKKKLAGSAQSKKAR